MTAVVDSSVLIDTLRALPEAVDYMLELEETPTCSEVTRIEVMTGLRSVERRSAERLFAGIDWVVVDERIARRAGELGRRWRRSHRGIDSADLAIAATAEIINADLATTNVKHFPMFPHLRPPY